MTSKPAAARVVATIEARMTSSRLPGKVLMPLAGKPALARIVERLRRVPEIDEVVLATTVNAADDPIATLGGETGTPVFRGSEEDVLLRVLEAGRSARAGVLVEITGDCPLVDPAVVREVLQAYVERNARGERTDYAANVLAPGHPLGLAVQVFSLDLLAEVERKTQDPRDREHVSLHIYEKPGRYRLHQVACPEWLRHPDWRWTLDYPEDYEFLARVYDELHPANPAFGSREVVDLLTRKPELLEINRRMEQKKARPGDSVSAVPGR